ncbi:MAG: type IIL restriction-modification enzyme MmeI, partial [Brachybacterium sp.]
TVANALQVEWSEVIPPTTSLYIMGNPPFLGDNTRGADQLADLRNAWGGDKVLSRMDYVTGWHAKTLSLFASPQYRGEWAFVTTNSVTQGDQVPRLYGWIFEAGWRIKFAHQTFAWSSEAPGAAAVHCVIVSHTQNTRNKPRLFEYERPKAEPREVPVKIGINAYLQDAKNILVEKRSDMLSPSLSKTWRGSMPTDDGNFIIEPEQHTEVMADPIAAKYVHKYVGAHELLHDADRWCLWLDGMDPADLNRSRVLRERVEAVRTFRAASKAASTREYPHHHLFRQLAKQDTSFVCVPRHVSETRRYFTVALFDEDVIAGDANFTIKDPDGFQFAIMSSSMFITWQKAIGGRIKSDLRFASTLTWYTLPLPAVEPSAREAIAAAGHGVLEARAFHPERSLAEHYNPLAMDPALVKAHDALDRLVDRAFGAKRKVTSNDERSKLLFDQYAAMTTEPSS